jgi:hypothetical protein
LQTELTHVGATMHTLGGSSTSIGSTGEIGTTARQITSLAGGVHGLEGKVNESLQTTIPGLSLSIDHLKSALAEAAESVAPAQIPGTEKPAEPQSNAELLALQKTLNEQLAQQLAVSQAQYTVLANLPPFAGHFNMGGVVPGPLGAARTAIVHGGEVINKAGESAAQVKIHVADGMSWLKQFIRVEVDQGTRGMSRDAYRALPSRGGGM